MSETEFEGAGLGGEGLGEGFSYEGGDPVELSDSFEPDFGERPGEQINQAVEEGPGRALWDMGLQAMSQAEVYAPEQPAPYEPTEQELAQADEALNQVFSGLEQELGGFDRDEAFQESERIFFDLVDQGVDPTEAISQALVAGAQDAAQTRLGEPLVDRLMTAELARVGKDVDSVQVRAAAEQFMPRLSELIDDPQEAARQAVEMAATAVAGHRWHPTNPNNQASAIARYYGQKGRAINAMDRVDQPAPKPAETKPGQRLSPTEIARKYGRR